jgi:2-polyprenyl-3-methyl-5-hydroxy-6-metoxy-1,4-benzoquinol methylase
MNNLRELLQSAYQAAAASSQRLAAIKKANASIAWYPFRTEDKIALLRLVTDYFDAVPPVPLLAAQGSVIDIGAADGDLSFLFESAGCRVTAIDNHVSNNNRCAGINAMKGFLGSGIEILDVDIDFDFAVAQQHDLILFLDILYHLRNPLGALINLARAGRYMVFSTRICDVAPDGTRLTGVPAAYLLAPMEAAPNDPTNYWIFTELGLQRTLERAGWRLLKSYPFGYQGDDSNPSEPAKDKRVICLCETMPGVERLKYGYVIA